MTTTARRSPFIWVTWLTGLLAADDSCRWAAWFKAHFTFVKVERPDNTLTKWKAEHADMVATRADALRALGYTVRVEDQNKFTLSGRVATLAGKPDLVALKDAEIRISDCKSGARKDKDFWQVAIYLVMWPLVQPDVCCGRTLVGELVYRTQIVEIPPADITPDVGARITAAIVEAGSAPEPARVPSARECAFCDIGTADCPGRLDPVGVAADVTTDVF